MPVVYKDSQMAECVNYGLGNEELRQGIISPGPMFADMIIRELNDFKCVDLNALPSQNEENSSRTLSLSSIDSSVEVVSPVIDNLSKKVELAEKESLDDNSDESSATDTRTEQVDVKHIKVPSNESLMYFLPIPNNKRNPWRRLSGFHAAGNELRSGTYPARSSVKKLRFAQAKKPLSYLYSYFSLELLDCDDETSITIGVTRKDYPSKIAPGKSAGSIGYCSDNGSIYVRDSLQVEGQQFSKGDVIGCGIIYPAQYKRYADLSTDDNSDGMTDVVLTSLLNKKSMDFVCNVLNLNAQRDEASSYDADGATSDSLSDPNSGSYESEYYNENFVESRTQVEVYFTYNMQVIGKVLSHIPIGGFYPTVHVFSTSAVKLNVDLNPPSS